MYESVLYESCKELTALLLVVLERVQVAEGGIRQRFVIDGCQITDCVKKCLRYNRENSIRNKSVK